VEVGPDKNPLEPGYRLDRYELLCPIAHGGMASVWLARLHGKHGFEKLVAVKTILTQFASDVRFQQMFLDEARIAAGIEHANVAQILDLGEQDDVLYLAMEWIDGDSLSKLHRVVDKRGERIPIGVVLRMLADASGGLHAAHELCDKDGQLLGVVHRDVSPQNILVSSRGVAKLIDFGIAKARDRVAGETNAGLLKGKIQYMPPEQAMGRPIDRRADVWAMGAVLYYLLAGSPPFDGPNQLATLHMLTSGSPPPPLPPHVPHEVAELIDAALAFHADERIATAADLQRHLEEVMIAIGEPTTVADVASYVGSQLADRAEARRRAVDTALRASADRARAQSLVPPPNETSNNGIVTDVPRSYTPQTDLGMVAAMQRQAAVPPVTGSGQHSYPPPPPYAMQHSTQAMMPVQPVDAGEHVSSATLGSAAVVFPPMHATIEHAGRKGLAATAGVLGALLLAAGVALLMVWLRVHPDEGPRVLGGGTAIPMATAPPAATDLAGSDPNGAPTGPISGSGVTPTGVIPASSIPASPKASASAAPAPHPGGRKPGKPKGDWIGF